MKRIIPRNIIFALIFFMSGCSSSAVYHPILNFDTELEMGLFKSGRIAIFSMDGMVRSDNLNVAGFLGHRSEEVVYSGLDAMSADDFALLRGRRFALLTNATGVDRHLDQGFKLMLEAGVQPALVFEPEHGMYGFEDEPGADGMRVDHRTGIKIFSLYSSKRKPDAEMLQGIDLIVVDLQNLPVRCYTFVSTLTDLMEIAEKNSVEVMVFDRPNPYGFWKARGSMLDMKYESFVGKAPVPFLYSMTLGEYANYMASTRFRNLKLSVITVTGYDREEHRVMMANSWINPSPNIPSFESAVIYPGMVFFEGTNVSLGRGTTRPFIYSGAPWMDSSAMHKGMKSLNLPGVDITEVVFRPASSLYTGKVVRGIQMVPYSVEFDPLRTGYEYMRLIKKIHSNHFHIKVRRNSYFMDRLWGGDGYRLAIENDLPFEEFEASWIRDSTEFQRFVTPYLLY